MKKSIKKYSVFWPAVFLAPFVICFFLFNLYPILYSFYMSSLDWAGYNEKVFVGFKNFVVHQSAASCAALITSSGSGSPWCTKKIITIAMQNIIGL